MTFNLSYGLLNCTSIPLSFLHTPVCLPAAPVSADGCSPILDTLQESGRLVLQEETKSYALGLGLVWIVL